MTCLWRAWYYDRGLGETEDPLWVNQFPFENVLTIKDLLCVVCRRRQQSGEENEHDCSEGVEEDPHPKWLPITFNLQTELPKFVSYYQRREKL